MSNMPKAIAEKMIKSLRSVAEAIEDRKGEDIRVLDVRDKSSVTDFIVLATGTSDPHLKAIQGAVDLTLKAAKTVVLGKDRNLASGWMVVDAFDFMVHLQTAEVREFYRLDQLWQDAEEVDIASF